MQYVPCMTDIHLEVASVFYEPHQINTVSTVHAWDPYMYVIVLDI